MNKNIKYYGKGGIKEMYERMNHPKPEDKRIIEFANKHNISFEFAKRLLFK